MARFLSTSTDVLSKHIEMKESWRRMANAERSSRAVCLRVSEDFEVKLSSVYLPVRVSDLLGGGACSTAGRSTLRCCSLGFWLGTPATHYTWTKYKALDRPKPDKEGTSFCTLIVMFCTLCLCLLLSLYTRPPKPSPRN
jgi:hypothetical protein